MFVGRKKELKELQKFYKEDSTAVMCLYGRQGMGKTALLQEFSKDKNTIFFTAYPTTDQKEVELFGNVLGVTGATDLSLLLEKMTPKNDMEKILLIIDHYPYFAKAEASYASTLYQFVTEKWQEKQVKIILCGDSYLHMEKLVYSPKALWHKQLSICMELTGLTYEEAKDFFQGESAEDAVFSYGISGGIPSHLKQLQKTKQESVQEIYLRPEDEAGLLPEKTMSMELRELSYYNRMLSTLAEGKSRVNEISEAVQKPKDVVVPYMNTLMSIGVVTKENPVTEKTNRKKTRYSIVNSHDVFWYRYIVPHMDLYYAGAMDELYKKQIQPYLNDYMKPVFIKMCREYLVAASQAQKVEFQINEIGNWWENDEEKKTSEGFDIVALGETEGKNATIFGRCYYTEKQIEIAELKELIDLTKRVKDKGEVYYIAFSKSGFHENAKTVAEAIKNIMLVSLKEIVQ